MNESVSLCAIRPNAQIQLYVLHNSHNYVIRNIHDIHDLDEKEKSGLFQVYFSLHIYCSTGGGEIRYAYPMANWLFGGMLFQSVS